MPIYDDQGNIIGYDNGSEETPTDNGNRGGNLAGTGSGGGGDTGGAGRIPIAHYDLGDRLLIVYADGSRETVDKGRLPAATPTPGSNFHVTQSLEDPGRLAVDQAKQAADEAHQKALDALASGNAAEARRQFDISQAETERYHSLDIGVRQQEADLAKQKFAADYYNKASEQAANPRNWLETFFQRRGQQAPAVAANMGSTPYNLTNAPTSMPFEQFAPKFLQGLGLGGGAQNGVGASAAGPNSGVGVPLGNAYGNVGLANHIGASNEMQNALSANAAAGAARVASALGPGVSFASGNLGYDAQGKPYATTPATQLGGQHPLLPGQTEDPTYQNFRQGLATAGLGGTVTNDQLNNPKDVGPNGIPIFAKPGAVHLSAPAFLVDAMSGKKLALAGEAGPENVMFSGKAIKDPDSDPGYVNPADPTSPTDTPPDAAPPPDLTTPPPDSTTDPYSPGGYQYSKGVAPIGPLQPPGSPLDVTGGLNPLVPAGTSVAPSLPGQNTPLPATAPTDTRPINDVAPSPTGMTIPTPSSQVPPPANNAPTQNNAPVAANPPPAPGLPSPAVPPPVAKAPSPLDIPNLTGAAPLKPPPVVPNPTPSFAGPGTNVPGSFSSPNPSAPSTGPSHWGGLTDNFGGGWQGGKDPNSILGQLDAQGAIPPFLRRIIAQAQGNPGQGTNTRLPWELPSDVPLLSKLAWNQLAPSEQQAFDSFLSAYGIDPADYMSQVEASAPHGMGESRFQPKFDYFRQ